MKQPLRIADALEKKAGVMIQGGNLNIVNFLDRNTKPVDSSGILPSELLQLRVKDTQKVFVKTRGYGRVREILQQFRHVTITGGVGEGKTSMALMLGVEYRQQGYQMVMVEDVDNFNIRSLLQSKVFVIFDDIFGSVGLKTGIGQLERMLEHLFLLKKKDKSVFVESESEEGGNINFPGLIVVFTTKSYNLNDGLQQMKGGKFDFFKDEAVLDLSKEQSANYTTDERMRIFESHKIIHKSNVSVSLSDFSRDHFGFPLICKLFFELGESATNTADFLTSPLSFLRKELQKLLSESSSRSSAFMLMLLCEDKLSLAKLEQKSEDDEFEGKLDNISAIVQHTRTQITNAVRSLRGTFFTEGDIMGFSHPVMYDACAVALATLNIAFVLKYCSLKFLYERVRASSGKSSQVSDNHTISISTAYHNLLCERFLQGIRKGQYSLVLTHPLLKVKTITDTILRELFMYPQDCDGTERFPSFRYDSSQIIHWVVCGQSRDLFDMILNYKKVLSAKEVHAAIKACAISGNSDVLVLLLSGESVHVKDDIICDAFLTAAENEHSEITKSLVQFVTKHHSLENTSTILSALLKEGIPWDLILCGSLSQVFGVVGISSLMCMAVLAGYNKLFKWLLRLNKLFKEDITISSFDGDNMLHLACCGGCALIVEELLQYFNINSKGLHGCTPIMKAAITGKKEVFDLLVRKGADLKLTDNSGDTVLHLACQGGNRQIVENILPLFDINSRGMYGRTPVMKVCTKKDVFDLLVRKGADLMLTDDTGDTVLHLACEGENIHIVEDLLPLFDINSRGMHSWTPVMKAAVCEKEDVFDLLVRKGANLMLTGNSGETLLHLACQGGNSHIVEYLLPMFDINSRGKHGWTPVMKAVVDEKMDVFELLVRKGANLKLTDNTGDTVLHLACQGGNRHIVEDLLPLIDINSRGMHDWTPVMTAAVCEKKDVFDLLVIKGADLKLTDITGDTVLHLACQGGNSQIVEDILPLFDINSRGKHGWTPVMKAAVCEKEDVFELLVRKGANLMLTGNSGETLLHLACQGGNSHIVEYLLPMFDINSRGKHGWTPVMKAVVDEKMDVFELLVRKGANLKLTDNTGDTVLHLACQGGNRHIVEDHLPLIDINSRGMHDWTPVMTAAVCEKKDVFDLLVIKGADLKLTDITGDTVLHLACQGGNSQIVEDILPLFDINSRGKHGWTPVMKAAVCEKEDIFELLVRKGANLMLTGNSGETLLHLACQGGNSHIVEYLLPMFDINSRGKHGWTPVMKAVVDEKMDVFELLVRNGANLKLTDDTGDTVLHLACQGGNSQIVEDILPLFDINSRGKHGWTPVTKAVVDEKMDVFELLVRKGANLKLTDNTGDTVLHLACQGGNRHIVKDLLPLIDINSRGMHDWTPVMTAAVCEKKDVFDLLVIKGADLKLTDDSGATVLHIACQGGNKNIVEDLLPMFDINSRGMNGWTPVMTAVVVGKEDVFDLLVKKGADLMLTDNNCDTLLHLASQGGNSQIVEDILPLFDINSRGMYGVTPVMKAVIDDKKDVFDLLVRKGADLKLTASIGDTVLHLACQAGNIHIVKYLLPLFDINSRGMYGRTPVMRAAGCNKKEVFDFLVKKGANLMLTDITGDTILHLACQGGNSQIVQGILPLFDINTRGMYGWTPVMKAVLCGNKDVFDLLVRKGANLKVTNNHGETVLHLACQGGNRHIVEDLLPLIDINSRGVHDSTPIMKAVFCEQKDVLDLLVRKGADLNMTNNHGDTVLHVACHGKNRNIVEYLLPLFDINSRGMNGTTPVMQAAVRDKEDVFDLLVRKGADLKLTDNTGDTVLHLACQGGNRHIVEKLLPLFDINSRGLHSWTPVMKAAVCEKEDVFELLVRKGANLMLTGDSSDNLLHLACQGGNSHIVEYLLPMFDINSRGKHGWTPVMKAVVDEKMDVFELLVRKGANLKLTDNTGDTVLHLACQGGNRNIVEYILRLFDINSRGMHGLTPVMKAVVDEKKDVFELLVRKGADLKLTDNRGDTLLHLACQVGNRHIVEGILPLFDVNEKGMLAHTPIMKAAICGQQGVFSFLLNKGADVNLTTTYGFSLVHLACLGGNWDIVKCLLSNLNIDLVSGHGWTPVMCAAYFGQNYVFFHLVKFGADLLHADNYNDSLIHLACSGGSTNIVGKILELFPHLNIPGHNGWTPVMRSAVSGEFDVFNLLVEMGADITITDDIGDGMVQLALQGGNESIIQKTVSDSQKCNKNPWTSTMTIAVSGYWNWLEIVDSTELTETDRHGDTVLHLACRGGNIRCVRFLLPLYDINVRGRHGWTPLMMAARCGHLDVFQCLLSHQADLKPVADNGKDILSLACSGRNIYIITELMLKDEFKQRDVHMTFNGYNRLHLACLGGNLAIVRDLLPDYNINVRGRYGLTPIMMAALCGHLDVIRYLLSHQADICLVSDKKEDVLTLAQLGKHKDTVNFVMKLPQYQNND